MDPRKTLLLELKQRAGLATPEELATLENIPLVAGNGLVTPRPSSTAEQWAARFAHVIAELLAPLGPDADKPAPAAAPVPSGKPPVVAPHRGRDGITLCAPDEEPAHPDKPRTHHPRQRQRGKWSR